MRFVQDITYVEAVEVACERAKTDSAGELLPLQLHCGKRDLDAAILGSKISRYLGECGMRSLTFGRFLS